MLGLSYVPINKCTVSFLKKHFRDFCVMIFDKKNLSIPTADNKVRIYLTVYCFIYITLHSVENINIYVKKKYFKKGRFVVLTLSRDNYFEKMVVKVN